MTLAELKEVSTLIGQYRDLVQGPGGNTSLKLGNHMYVKASGTKLVEANSKDIFAVIEVDTGIVVSQTLRPSIEKDLHLALPFNAVIHVHSVGSLTWALRELDNSSAEFFDSIKIAVLPYFRPGRELAEAIKNITDIEEYRGLLLQNHGLITWGDTPISSFHQLLNIENALLTEALRISSLPSSKFTRYPQFLGEFFTPDHAVFDTSAVDDSIRSDLIWSLDLAISMIPTTTNILKLESQEVKELQSWEAEKYRRNLNP
jgi:rhamnose utilization protein RhaD (predicted bifunctional aldolase and dehydrogenase)